MSTRGSAMRGSMFTAARFSLPRIAWGIPFENGTWVSYGATPADYSTDVLAGKAQAILSTAAEPFFLYFNTKAPHQSFTPAPRHKGLLQGVPITRSPNFNEADVSDKPAWVRKPPLFSASEEGQLDRGQRGASETLLSVDEAMRGFMDTLSARGILDNTVIVFMTDNGLSYGSHRWARDKRCVYEECVRTPLLIRYPGAESRTESKLALNTDIAPTLAELAGISPSPQTDGVSLVPLLTNSAGDWRSSILFEYQEGGKQRRPSGRSERTPGSTPSSRQASESSTTSLRTTLS